MSVLYMYIETLKICGNFASFTPANTVYLCLVTRLSSSTREYGTYLQYTSGKTYLKLCPLCEVFVPLSGPFSTICCPFSRGSVLIFSP